MVVVAIVLSFLIKTFLFRAFYIPSESMVNTLDVNDRIFVNLLVPEPMALQRGDVVVFRDSQGWLAPAAQKAKGPFTWVQDGLTFVGLLPDNSEQHLVKRVIGLPGDHVVCCDAGGQLTVNGAPLDEKYINSAEIPQVRDFDVVVPAGKVWVMGDNRNHSADSRAHMDTNGGFVNESDIEGKAAVIAWPLNRMSALDNYPDVFRERPRPVRKVSRPSCQQPPPSTTNAASAAPAPGSSRASTRSAAAPWPVPSAWESPSWTCSSRSSWPMSGTASCSRSRTGSGWCRWSGTGASPPPSGMRPRTRSTNSGSSRALRLAGNRAWLAVLAAGVRPEVVLLDGSHNWLSPGSAAVLV